jgi:hypothetical protein
MVGIIIFGIVITISLIALLISSISIWWLGIELHFLCLRLENHPVLKAMVDDVLQAICDEEGLKVFHKTYDEMNGNETCEAEKAVGLYVYTHDKEWQERAKQRLLRLEELEAEYNMPYKDICASVGKETDITKEDFTLPRILLCEEKLLEIGGINSYYSSYFHEIGHHFIEKSGGIQTEDDADKMAQKIILERLPFFFQLIPNFRYCYRVKGTPELTTKEKRIAYIGYLKYYWKYKDTIIKKEKKCNKPESISYNQ